MVKTYGRGGGFNIASADSMGVKQVVDPGRPGDGDDAPRPIRPIIDPIRDDPPDPVTPITVEQTEDEDAYYGENDNQEAHEQGQSILDDLGFDNEGNGNAFLDDYALIGLIALTAIGVTLLG